ncbi:hypothetical protein [Streptomyces achromogenes]|uniref:hypothetical protein n=1 Tax=Streptomyces achromogenes TaxID=67255 RepID=UPI00369F3CB3
MAPERIRWPAVVDRAREIMESYEGGVTLRQVMYRLVSEGVLPHTPSMYRHLSSHLAQARREQRFPDLIDTLREIHVPLAWPDAAAYLREAVDWFTLDRTQGQRPVYVAAEKDTLRKMFTSWLAEYGIPVLVVRGFASQSHADVVRGRATLLWWGDVQCHRSLSVCHRRLISAWPGGPPLRNRLARSGDYQSVALNPLIGPFEQG